MLKPVILWAMDPLSEKAVLKKAAQTLNSLNQDHQFQIQPVYVLCRKHLEPLYEMEKAFFKVRKAALNRIQNLSDKLIENGLMKAHVLLEKSGSTTHAAKKLAVYAKKSRADLVVLSTHSGNVISKLFMGGFAESFLYQCQIPNLFVNLETKVPKRISSLLVPTYPGIASTDHFENHIFPLAKKYNSKIVIYSKVTNGLDVIANPMVPLFSGGWVSFQKYFSKQEADLRTQFEECKKIAMKLGLRVEVIIDTSPAPLLESIHNLAKSKKVSAMVLSPQTSKLMTALIGSTTLNIVRSAPVPIFVVHTDKFKRAKKETRNQIASPYSNYALSTYY